MEGAHSGRSLVPVHANDLVRLAAIAAEAWPHDRHPQIAGRYAGRLLRERAALLHSSRAAFTEARAAMGRNR
jgi:hypothetical protein